MLIPIVQSYQKRFRPDRRRRPAAPTPPPAALTLVSASYDQTAKTLTMTFDRAIDISGFDGAEIEVDDGTYNHGSYVAGDAATLVNATTVRATLHFLYGGAAGGVLLSASAINGIVAVDDGAAWGGTEGMELPYP